MKIHLEQIKAKDKFHGNNSGFADSGFVKTLMNSLQIYSWGDRALVEVKKSEILKFVAEIYEKEPSEFTEQYENIRNIEGEDVFADE